MHQLIGKSLSQDFLNTIKHNNDLKRHKAIVKLRDERARIARKQRAAKIAAQVASTQKSAQVYQTPSSPVQSSDYYVNWIIQHESGGNPYAVNPSSGACGLFQRYPCSVTLGDTAGQMADGLAYIASRYGTAYNAYLYWQAHGNY